MSELLEANLLLETCPVGLIVVAATGVIEQVNGEIERMFGYHRDELVGRASELLVSPEKQHRYRAARRLYFLNRSHISAGRRTEFQARRRDGSPLVVEVALAAIAGSDPARVLAAVWDITEQRALEQEHALRRIELERSNAELEQFAAIASHDMREPLRMVISYTELLAEDFNGKLDARTQKFMGYVIEGAKRMQRLIDDLLAYSRLEARAQPLVPTHADDALRDVLQDMRPLIQESAAVVTHGELPILLVDPVQLDQLLANVIGNAIKFRGEHPPRVHVRADAWQGMWRIAIEDNGIGIDKRFSQRIFQMFQRLHERNKYEGSGIGLAVAKKIVERHGGQIWVDSNEGHGSTFYFTLPGIAQTRAS